MNKRLAWVLVTVVLLAVAGTAGLYVLSIYSHGSSRALPDGCVKPKGGYLVVASDQGFNDSIPNGAPLKQWPIITVKHGQNVTITVCNIDNVAHGFQISNYLDKSEVSIAPGQVYHVDPFLATTVGNFTIYCDVFCPIHQFMQNGLFKVTA